ncbi:MAG TPA: hypothetical protein DCL54_03820, partial [Alphaproteobacteria bacterium]|nr:hypothetical protein [Alphaproteobacteria bacterium]
MTAVVFLPSLFQLCRRIYRREGGSIERQFNWQLDTPCRQDDAPQQMVLSGHCGWYMRVLGPGTAPVQGSLTFVSREAGSPTVRETFLA